MTIIEARNAIVTEAERWLKTPFHHEARVLGAGVDCGQLLIAVYGALGYFPMDYPVEHYPADFAAHNKDQWYLRIVSQFAKEVASPPQRGDIVLYHWGKSFSHGGIVDDWPTIIHAWAPMRMVTKSWGNVGKLEAKEKKFFSVIRDEVG